MYSRNLDYEKLLNNFLQFKKSCGYKYISETIIIKSFGSYVLENKQSSYGLTKEFVQEWATLGVNEGRKSLSNRVSVLREFGIYLSMLGYKVHIPKPIQNSRNKNFIPYVFSKDEINKILFVTDNLENTCYNRYNSHEVYPILFRMLYGCGLRISEALNLKIKNVDIQQGKLVLEVAKYDKQRIVPMSQSLTTICYNYKMKYLLGKDDESTFFQHKDGAIRKKHQAGNFFKKILYQAGIAYLGNGKGPYIHNLRHTFACHAFHQMHEMGIDMNVGLPLLSTYLGHESIKATEKYLWLYQEVFTEIVSELDKITCNVYTEITYEK